MIKKMATGALIASALLAPAAPASAVNPPTEVTLNAVAVNGTGCPIGTAAIAVSPDRKAFTITYSSYMAVTSQANAVAEKACQVVLNANIPPAFTYAISEVQYRGWKELYGNARGELAGVYYFQGGNQTTQYTIHAIPGGVGNWQINDSVPFSTNSAMPCGERRYLNIKTRLTTFQQNATGTNYLSMDSLDGQFSTKYHFTWLQC